MELNKHQIREANAYAAENNVSFDAACKALFPDYARPEAAQADPEEPEPAAKKTAAKA